MENLKEMRKLELDELRKFPDGIRIYAVCISDSAIDTSYFTGWYRKCNDHVQNNKGFINFDNPNFEFYVKFRYSLPVAQQLLFDIAVELEGGYEHKSNSELSARLFEIIKQIDYMDLWKKGE